MGSSERNLLDGLAASIAEADAGAGDARRQSWWQHLVEAEEALPGGAVLVGWDTVVVTHPDERDAAEAIFRKRPSTFVTELNLHKAWELGLRDEAADHDVAEPDDNEEEFPCVVAALQWAAAGTNERGA
ncbi:hypothetical protein [Nocardiopsis rhodophaea]|uniref:hypothetical protein n=1 Tax=Nocardiopsis rhodophaea TaxID=280238 RepID=UPI0031D52AD3